MRLLSLYEKFEKVVQKLPDGLQKPILRELDPIKTLFLLQRPPRIVLLGERRVSRSAFLNALFHSHVAEATEDDVQDGRWQSFTASGRGTLKLLDARRP